MDENALESQRVTFDEKLSEVDKKESKPTNKTENSGVSVFDDAPQPTEQRIPPRCNNLSIIAFCNLALGLGSLALEMMAYREDLMWDRVISYKSRFPKYPGEKYFSGRFVTLDKSNIHIASALDHLRRESIIGKTFIGITSIFLLILIVHLLLYCTTSSVRRRTKYADGLYLVGGLVMFSTSIVLGTKAVFNFNQYHSAAEDLAAYVKQLNSTCPTDHNSTHSTSNNETNVKDMHDIEENVLADFNSRQKIIPRVHEACYWKTALIVCALHATLEEDKVESQHDSLYHGFGIEGYHYDHRTLEKLGFCDEEFYRNFAFWVSFLFSLICLLIPCVPCIMNNRVLGRENQVLRLYPPPESLSLPVQTNVETSSSIPFQSDNKLEDQILTDAYSKPTGFKRPPTKEKVYNQEPGKITPLSYMSYRKSQKEKKRQRRALAVNKRFFEDAKSEDRYYYSPSHPNPYSKEEESARAHDSNDTGASASQSSIHTSGQKSTNQTLQSGITSNSDHNILSDPKPS